MSGVFEPAYAHHYDALYGEKNYAAECDAIEELFRRYSATPPRALLDLGCGTGTHALLLSERGYAVTGVDRSPAMLALAREKIENAVTRVRVRPEFLEGDIRALQLGRTFDAALMLFAVLGYQTSDADVSAAMRSVASHLRPGGVFICDLWFGPAVLAIGTSDRVKVIDEPGGQLHRTSSGLLDTANHTCRVNFQTWRTIGDRVVDESAEAHTMRYFFQPELERFFNDAGLELCAISPFENLDVQPGPGTWNVWVCGRARGAA